MDYEVFEMPPRGQRRISDYGRAFVSYFSRMLKAFGWRFLCFLLMSQLLLKGFAHYLIDLSLLPLFKGGGQRGRIRFWSLRNTNSVVDAKMLQLYTMVIMVPWSLKPIMGLLSDFLLIFGYHKRFWLFLVCVLGMMASVTFTVFFSMRNVVIMVVCFAVIQLQISVFDLLSESAYSERMRDVPQSGTDLVTLTQGYQDVGAIVTAVSAGPLAETGSWYVFSGLVIACTTLPLIPTAFNWLGEKRWPRGMPLTQKQHVVHTVSVETSSKWQVAVIVFAGLAAPVTAVITTTYEPRVALAVALSVVGIALTGTYWAFSPLIFRIVLYQVGTRIFSPSLGSAMDYFYTADEQCLPGGPHFSFVYYMTYVSIVGTVVSFFASMFYQVVLSGMRFRHVLIFTQVLSGLIGFSDLFIVTRTNIAMGLPDKWAYMLGEAVMESALNTLHHIPAATLLSKGLPRGLESSVFAFSAGMSNFARMISSLSGAILFEEAGIRSVPPCNFSALWWLVLLFHIVMPIVFGVGFSFLIPNKKQNEEL